MLKSLLNKSKYLKICIWVLIIIPGIPFIGACIIYTLYAFWPRDFSQVTQFDLNKQASHFTISAHGVKDNPGSWSDQLQQVIADNYKPQNHNSQNRIDAHQGISLNWQPHSDNPLICSVIAKRIGKEIGIHLAQQTEVKLIHGIGHSCGSFVILGLCEAVKSIKPAIKIQTTYLDPVPVYAGFGWDYGVNTFGSCADFSDAYIDTQDTVPGSNQKLTHAHTFNVTQIRLNNQIEVHPHNWPNRYYLKAYREKNVPLLSDKNSDINNLYPRNKMTNIESFKFSGL